MNLLYQELLLVLSLGFVVNAPAQNVNIVFDYTYDPGGLVTQNQRNCLEAAASYFEGLLGDSLLAITPGGANTWTAAFTNPGDGTVTQLADLSIAANSLLVFVGARELGGSTAGRGGPGGYAAGGSQAWLDTVTARGQTGALGNPATDFGPWGGTLALDINTSWYVDPNPATVEGFPGLADFYSVALHELGHVLGYGTAGSWTSQISNGTFTGPASSALYGGNVPLANNGHWADGLMRGGQEVAMDPSLLDGTRKYFTDLDVAGLQDIGWQTVPEPGVYGSVMAVGLVGWVFLQRIAKHQVPV